MKINSNLGIALLVISLIILSYGFKNKSVTSTNNSSQLFKKELKITGNELFQKNCSVCHGIKLQGNPPTFPSLVNISQKLSKNQISELLKTGRNVMPNFSHLSNSEREAIVGYLYGELIETEIVTEVTSIERGENLFIAKCATCHQPNKTSNPNVTLNYWKMKPINLGGISKAYNLDQFKKLVNLGSCSMPSFASMDNKNIEDIYTYLNTLKSSSKNSNNGKRRGCGN
jgi:mono/diheme cytochrome c family protein